MSAAGMQEHGKPDPGGEKKEEHHGPKAMEIVLMLGSIAVAAASILYGWRVFKIQEGKPAEKFVAEHREFYELVRDKYRVDEFYQSFVVDTQLALSEGAARFDNAVIDGAVNGAAEAGAATSLYTGYFDNEVVDGAVNGAAKAAQAAGRGTRKIQTGNIRAYIAASVIGGLFVIAFFCLYVLWHRGVLFGL
jgi:NADH-quinone oxidoreductase subunit L